MTTFYVLRRSEDAEIEGPFSVEQINQMIHEKRLTVEALAIANTGQGLQAVQSTSLKCWITVADIPGCQPDPVEERDWLTAVPVILFIIAIIVGFILNIASDIFERTP